MRNPVILVSVSPEIRSDLRRISAASEQSVSSIVRELIEAAQPVLVRLAETLEKAKAARVEHRSAIVDAFRSAEVVADAARLDALAAFMKAADSLSLPSHEAPEEGVSPPPQPPRAGRAAPAAEEDRPPSVITGVRKSGIQSNQRLKRSGSVTKKSRK